jgi:hypothetical protein
MNTPAHVVLNLLVLGSGRRPRGFAAVSFGAILPDLPMVIFYGIQKIALATPERVIWGHSYFEVGWQAFFDLFNSFPLIALAAAFAWGRRSWTALLLLASMALHACADLPLHHDDAHRHFFPLSDWRFASPVSYWDPAYYGDRFLLAEFALMLFGSVWLWRRNAERSSRAIVALVAGLYLAFVGYAFRTWA